jgi:hypothetical protein
MTPLCGTRFAYGFLARFFCGFAAKKCAKLINLTEKK